MKAVVFTLGCKVNEVESASLMAELENRGWETSSVPGPADVYILNTCAVTREAERKSRQAVTRMSRFSPAAPVYVCGCASGKNAGGFERENVRFIGGAGDKESVINAIVADFGGESCLALGNPKQVKTRAFIKIEDGCNNFCSYCIIPYLRGRVKSRPIADVVAEVLSCNSSEIVITGINISAYKTAEGGLSALVSALCGADKRIRLGSLECNVIDDELLTALKGLKDFAPQFHLSLQSGSSAVLRAMNRHYTREEYLSKCSLIYKYFPDAAITADIIAGFCGESEEDFNESLSIIDEAGFARIHAFAFSPREGTKAYSMKDVPSGVKSERLHRLLAAAKVAEDRFISARLGKTYSVIFEEFDGRYTCGYTENYIKVYVEGEWEGKRSVTLKSLCPGGAIATLSAD